MAQRRYKHSMTQPFGMYCSLPSAGEKILQAMSAFEQSAALPDPHCTTDDPTMLGEENFEILQPYTPTDTQCSFVLLPYTLL
jgi:hypothetical protein